MRCGKWLSTLLFNPSGWIFDLENSNEKPNFFPVWHRFNIGGGRIFQFPTTAAATATAVVWVIILLSAFCGLYNKVNGAGHDAVRYRLLSHIQQIPAVVTAGADVAAAARS